MKLFHTDKYRYIADDGYPQLLTPLGDLALDIRMPQFPQSDELHVHHYRHNFKPAELYQLNQSGCLIEILSVAIPLIDMAQDTDLDCRGFLIRIQAFDPAVVHVRLGWLLGYHWADACPESGEWLEAKTWNNEKWKVTIGTEDSESLAARAKVNQWMPQRLAYPIAQSATSIVDIDADSVSIHIPELLVSERCQLQFIVASNRNELIDDISTWLAVAQHPTMLLRCGDCQ